MSDFGEEIIKRLSNENIQKSSNPMNRVLNNTVGEWLQQENDKKFFEQFFLTEADNEYLDLHGRDFGVKRKINEDDESYRKRIIHESMGHITVEFLKTVYDIDLFSFVEDFDVLNNTLVSDNPYYSLNGFMGSAPSSTKEILDKKFIIGSGVSWID